MTPLPKGWTRRRGGTLAVEWCLGREILVQVSPVVPSMPHVRILGLDDDDHDVQIFDRPNFDGFLEILNRAWRQVEHYKAGGVAPLSEDEESRDVPVRVHRIWVDGVEREVQPGDEALLGLPEPDPDPALSMAHACACAVCEFCAFGCYPLIEPDGDGSYMHDMRRKTGAAIPPNKCRASAIHRLIGTKAGP